MISSEIIDDKVIDGRELAQKMSAELAAEIYHLKNHFGIIPVLVIIQVGDNHASNSYINSKQKAAKLINIETKVIKLAAAINTRELKQIIEKQNNDAKVSGIIVQLPLPTHIDQNIILAAIDPSKDVDGFHPINVGYLHIGMKIGFVPCTALGILALLKSTGEILSGKQAVIIGRSNIVSKPLAALLLAEDATVTICHSKTQKLAEITKQADIVIVAVGSPKKFTKQYFKKDAIVIDVGINRVSEDLKIVGDVDFQQVVDQLKFISPVPGGVGPMTVYYLLSNVCLAAKMQRKISNLNG